jgi:myo-inositol-1(or 4)-monophosphatase
MINVSKNNFMADVIYATGFSYTLTESNYNNLDNFAKVTVASRGTRRFGAAALDLAYVACARFDGYWETGLKVWDMAAGALLVREAGGLATCFDQSHWKPTHSFILTSNGYVHDELAACLTPYYDV